MVTVKCRYCGKYYFTIDDKDYCPHCGKRDLDDDMPDFLNDIFGNFRTT